MKAPEYLAINPMGKVPALSHGDAVVTETAAICTYLADAFPEAGLAPPPATGCARRTIAGCSSPPARWRPARPTRPSASRCRPSARALIGYGSLEEVAALEAALDGRSYLVGDRFSAADVESAPTSAGS